MANNGPAVRAVTVRVEQPFIVADGRDCYYTFHLSFGTEYGRGPILSIASFEL